MIVSAISKVVRGNDLTRDEAQAVMTVIMEGSATDAQIASLLTALRMKGETVDEITGFATVMREKAVPVRPKQPFLIDTCGTGGDETGTFNISTTAAFVVAGAGVYVAKHGNRSVSSQCGSADVLEALGVNIDLDAVSVADVIDEVGIGFLFAPALHTAMKYVMPARKQTGIRTVFNILGPLTNPARAQAQVVGVYRADLTKTLAQVLGNLGQKHVLVVHGADGLDELSTTGTSMISELKDGRVDSYTIEPADVGFDTAQLSDIKGGTAKDNARILSEVLCGASGPRRDIVLLNSAAALVAADKTRDLKEGIEIAAASIADGSAFAKLRQLITVTNAQVRI